MKNTNKRKGFTLVELLVVIAILAILATVSIVGYTSFINKARKSNAETEAAQIRELIMAGVLSGDDYYLTADETAANCIYVSSDSKINVGTTTDLGSKKIAKSSSITDCIAANSDLAEILTGGNYLTVDSTNNYVIIYHAVDGSLKVTIKLADLNGELSAEAESN